MHSNWTVTGIVTFDHAFMSHGQIGCRWTRKSISGQSEIPEREVKLQEQEEDEGGRRFFGGSCVMVTSLSDTSGDVYNFTVDVTPGAGPVLAGSVTIKKPGELRLQKSSCPDVIAEGQDVSCKCRHTSSSKPFPPALLTWVDSSTSSDVLELRNINREQNGRVHVCRSEWGPGGEVVSSVSYSPRVVYGPSRAEVTTDDDLDPGNVTLTCRVQGEVFPSASLTWNVPCTSVSDTNVSSTCTLRRDQVDRSGRDVVVECVATNSELSSLNATASLTLLFLGKEEVPKTEEALPLGLIVGIVTGVVVAAAVVAVIIIIVVRRKRANAPVHEIPMREAQLFSSGTAQAHQTSADNAGTRAQQTSTDNARTRAQQTSADNARTRAQQTSTDNARTQGQQTSADNARTRAQQTSADNAGTRAQQTSADNAGTRASQTSADNAGDHYYMTVIDASPSVQSPAGDSDYEIPPTGTGPDMGGQPSSPGARDDTPEYVNRRAMGDNSQDDNSGDADYEIPDSATGPEIRAQSSSSGRGDDSPEYVNEGATGDNSQNDYMNTERLYSHLTATGGEHTYVQLNKP
ncbi:uncharacterized protein LOC143277651 [Babylonia areolata]|uniref:uncharacterized protein LOC143277651 n=1 Tax=Babylonia areolata TaxID=304850 RepID=UPI003FD0FEBE